MTEPTALRDDAVRFLLDFPRAFDAGRFAADLVVVFFAEAGFLEREDEAFDRLFEVERDALFDR